MVIPQSLNAFTIYYHVYYFLYVYYYYYAYYLKRAASYECRRNVTLFTTEHLAQNFLFRCLLDSLYDLSSHGLYTSLDLETPHLSGDNVTFSCKTPFPRLNNVTVTCTSSGTYSAPPPYCTEREKQSSE